MGHTVLDKWAEDEEGEKAKVAGVEKIELCAAPATLPTGVFLLDRTFLLYAVASTVQIAEAYYAVVGCKDAPQARELPRPVASHSFLWVLDADLRGELSSVLKARWRALCLDNVAREATQLLEVESGEGKGEAVGTGTKEGDEVPERLLRIDQPHAYDDRMMRIFWRFLFNWGKFRWRWAGPVAAVLVSRSRVASTCRKRR